MLLNGFVITPPFRPKIYHVAYRRYIDDSIIYDLYNIFWITHLIIHLLLVGVYLANSYMPSFKILFSHRNE